MPFKTILTVTETGLGNGDIEITARLCAAADAHLTVLVVQMAPPPPIGEFAAMASDVWLEERREDAKRLAARREELTAFTTSLAAATQVVTQYPELTWSDEAIGHCGFYADLTVIGPETLGSGTLGDKAIEGALFSSGRPLLLVPKGTTVSLAPKRVVVAWDARREAARAVREGLEIMTSADVVSVLLVDPEPGSESHGAEPGADIATYLARHGAHVEVNRLPAEGKSTAAIVRRHLADFGADMLIMGGYGHSRIRERIFGGVTEDILRQPPVATFMAR